MFLEFDAGTLEKMTEGVVMLDRNGQVIDFNRAAKPWLKSCARAADKISAIVRQTIRENSKTPLLVDLFPKADAEIQAAEVLLCSDGKDGFALLFTPVRGPVQEQASASQQYGISQLIGDEIRHEFTQLIHDLGAIHGDQGNVEVESVRQRARHLRSMFMAMDELSRIAEAGSMVPGERLTVSALLTEAIGAIPFRHCDYYINESAGESATAVGAVYGNGSWIKCALQALLECLEDGAPSKSHITLTMRQNGGFLVLTARPSSLSDGGAGTAIKPNGVQDSAVRLVASVRLPLARRIVELHGGQLRVVAMDADPAENSCGVESFTLLLPTGSPANQRSPECENCGVNQQATAYARDLAILMPQLPKGAEVSDEERAFLMHVTHAK